MNLTTSQGPKLTVVFPRINTQAGSTSRPDPRPQNLLSNLLSNRAITNGSAENEHIGASISVTLHILPNADVSVIDQNILPQVIPFAESTENEQQDNKEKISKLSRAIAISGDIGIWTEWVSKWAARSGR
jgi:hypothetical protein